MTILRKLSSFVVVAVLVGFSTSACSDKDSADIKGGSKAVTGGGESLTAANFAQVIADSQAKAKSVHVDMTIGVAGQKVTAQGDVAIGSKPADSAMVMTMDMGPSASFEMRLVDQTMFMNMGELSEGKFLKIDLSDGDNALTRQFGQMLDQMDPAKQMAQLDKAVTSFEKKGEPMSLDGVKAQPYVMEVDTSKIDSFKDLPGSSASMIPKSIVYTIYIGPDDLLRRMTFDIAGSEATIDYSKWGEPVEITAPSAGEISERDLAGLMSGLPPA